MHMTASIEDTQAASTFSIESDSIRSFGHLVEERARVFAQRRSVESFRRSVHALAEEGESGRRKGLGLWMTGEYEAAIALLESYPTDDVATFTRANALVSLGRHAEAVPVFEGLTSKYPDESKPRGGMLAAKLEAVLEAEEEEAAVSTLRAELAEVSETFRSSAEAHYLYGRCAELERHWQEALDHYLASREVDPTYRANLFHLAHLAERRGLDELALEVYETLASILPIDLNVMVNLGVLYEDLGRDQDAATCYDTVVATDPMHTRARLFLADARAGMEMYYDEDQEKKEDRLGQVLRTPISDFELSVRARNCLNNMDILTLGDLLERSEVELLSFKNFGETSLNEIKDILHSKGLRLGMDRKEAVARISSAPAAPTVSEDDPSALPISRLQLSIRARRAVESLGCMTLGDITAHSENEMLGMPNFGVTSLTEIKSKLAEQGLSLKPGK